MSAEPSIGSRAAAWQQHLRQGGKVPWRDFSGSTAAEATVASAVHLELVRRLDGSLPDFAALADLVLTTPAPGRGSVDVPLAGNTTNPYGAPPVEPESLPPSELLRLAVGVLDRLIGGVPAPARPQPEGGLRPRRHFQVAGTPISCKLARRGLLGAGWREHPRRATQFVFGAPLPDAVAQLWVDRVAAGSTTSWAGLWRRLASREELPRRLRFDQLAQSTGKRGSPIFGTAEDVAGLLHQNYGLSMGPAMDLVATSLMRRLNAILATRMNGEERRRATPVITEVIGCSNDPLSLLRVPAAQRDWAAAQRESEPGYPREPTLLPPRLVPDDRTLGLALAAIGRGWVRLVKESE